MKSDSKSKSPLHRSLRCTDDEIAVLLNNLDSADNEHAQGRSRECFSFRRTACVVRIQQPGAAETAAHQVTSRDLSAEGMDFLHGGFVHRGSKCIVQLISTHGAWEEVPGIVVACRHVQGLIHEIGVEFEHEIDVGQFCPDAVKTRVLLAEADHSIAQLVILHLSTLNTELTHVENGHQVIEHARGSIYDVILMEMELPVLDGFEVARILRDGGYVGKIIAATALTDPADRERCIQAGCDGHIPKPYTKDDLATLLKSLQEEPLFSSMADDPSMTEMIGCFCDELPAALRAIEEAFAAEDRDNLERFARGLKGRAGAFGFEPITSAAATIETGVRKKSPAKDLKPAVDYLTKLCLMARASC